MLICQKMEYQEKICRLCITKCTNNFECIEEITKDMLDTLLIKINLGISDEPVLCTNCTDIIQRCLAFKSICLSTENCIVLFVNEVGQSELNLKEIYQIVKNEQIEIPDDHSVCRFCMDLIENEQKAIISGRIMLEKCLPELDLTVTKNFVICSECQDHLQNYYSFIMNCSKVEEMINKYYESTVINREGLIKLIDVIQFTARKICEEGDTENKPKKEEEENLVEIKHEQFMEMEDQKFDGSLQHSPKTMFGSEEDDNKINITKIEIKIEQEEETSVEMESQPVLSCEVDEIKIEHHDLDRLQDNVILPRSEVSIKLSKKESSLLPVTRRIISPRYRVSSIQTKCKGYLQKKLICTLPSKSVKLIFKCEFCPYRTYLQGHFRRHLPIHKNSEIKMFKCESCSYQTKYKSCIKTHKLIHKKPSEITMFECESCSYQTRYKAHLNKHIWIHKNPSEITMFKCESCSYQTRYKTNLSKHILIHKNLSEVTVFECASCSYQTRYKSNLKGHILTHKSISEISMFQCVHCSFQTKYKTSLRIHTKRIHNRTDTDQ